MDHAPFDRRHVAAAPAAPGVYMLYRGERLIFIGCAAPGATIRQALQQHLRGERGADTAQATEFDYETSAYARWRYRNYLNWYREATGGLLPACNKIDDR
jgi:hypothetical protein